MFEFLTGRIVFGPGVWERAPEEAAAFGRRSLLATCSGSTDEAAGRLEERLRGRGLAVTRFRIPGEPDRQRVEAGLAVARAAGCDLVVALGGGSAIDGAKAIAGLLGNDGNLADHLEVVGRGEPLTRPALPLIAIPTTAGTGTEVTRNAVIAVPEERVKVSLRSHHLVPRLALVDPTLTYTLPPEVTATTGLDALTQLIEPLTSRRATPLADAVAEAGLGRAARSLLAAFREGTTGAREDMAFASLCGGIALANAGLGAVHGFAAVLGGRWPIPHGLCCAMLLPHVVDANLAALARREPRSPAVGRYARVASILAGDEGLAGAPVDRVRHELGARLRHLLEEMHVPALAGFGVGPRDLDEVVARARRASSMKGNPVDLEDEELRGVLEAALRG